MNINDIVQLVLLCAAIFFSLEYLVHRRFPYWLPVLRGWLLPPRYMKSAGVWRRGDLPADPKKKPS